MQAPAPDLRAQLTAAGESVASPGSSQAAIRAGNIFSRRFVARVSRKARLTLSAWPLGPAGVWGPGDSPSRG